MHCILNLIQKVWNIILSYLDKMWLDNSKIKGINDLQNGSKGLWNIKDLLLNKNLIENELETSELKLLKMNKVVNLFLKAMVKSED